MTEARSRILDVALQVLASNPDAGMGDITLAAGVLRRTMYGQVRSLVQLAVNEVQEVLDGANATGRTAPQVWADFISCVWPLAHRYRVLVVLRSSEYGRERSMLFSSPLTTASRILFGKGGRPVRSAGTFPPTSSDRSPSPPFSTSSIAVQRMAASLPARRTSRACLPSGRPPRRPPS